MTENKNDGVHHHGDVHQYGDNDDREQAPVVEEAANLWPHYPPPVSQHTALLHILHLVFFAITISHFTL